MTTVVFWAGARAATGVREEPLAARTVSDALAEVAARHPAVRALLDRSVLLVDGERVTRDERRELGETAVLEVLPPFAGGAR